MNLKSFIRKLEWILPAAAVAVNAAPHLPASASMEMLDTAESLEKKAAASEAQADPQAALIDKITQNIATRYPGAKITVAPKINWSHRSTSDSVPSTAQISLLGETARGEMMFAVTAADGRRDGDGWVEFAAWMPAYVAAKRIHPMEKVTPEMFTRQEVNVAIGQPHEVRGVILTAESPLVGLETRQSVLEGQILLSSAVQRVPDVRRGDVVSVHLISNGLSLQTNGVAEEPGYSGEQLRVTASKTKRELVGKLGSNGIVEVRL